MTVSTSQFISLPEALAKNLDKPFCISGQATLSRGQLLEHAVSLSEQLPDKNFAINLCRDRYLFIVAFLAAAIRKQIALLPPNQSARTISNLLTAYPNSYCLIDHESGGGQDYFRFSRDGLKHSARTFPAIDTERTLSISFTSGSTGAPKPVAKNWREFQSAAKLALKQFDLAEKSSTLVATVAPQHMYGLETSLFWPLFSSLAIDNSWPFYPEDIRRRLQAGSNPKILIATPTHLKACAQSEINWPPIDKILSSTAPLTYDLARATENALQAPLYELFGSTETLSFASRRTVKQELWRTYEGMRLTEKQGAFVIQGGHLEQPIVLEDRFNLESPHCFKILGRSADLIKIAGKRASLTELNQLLNAIEGVSDGVFFKCHTERMAVLVVSELSKNEIIAGLKPAIDAVFLPRQVFKVTTLPRNAMGKMIQTELDALIQELRVV